MKEDLDNINTYLQKEVEVIVEELFIKLRKNNINIQLEKKELTEKELNIYLSIYKEYEEKLINLKNTTIMKFGCFNNFDYIFAKIIQNVVNKYKNYE